jgi:hypothetical protein
VGEDESENQCDRQPAYVARALVAHHAAVEHRADYSRLLLARKVDTLRGKMRFSESIHGTIVMP